MKTLNIVATCGTCKCIIDDSKYTSIECSTCETWVHSAKKCSGIKASIFKLISSKDSFVCPNCITFCKEMRISSAQSDNCDVAYLSLKLKELEKNYADLVHQNNQLLKQIDVKDRILGRLDSGLGYVQESDSVLNSPSDLTLHDASSQLTLAASSQQIGGGILTSSSESTCSAEVGKCGQMPSLACRPRKGVKIKLFSDSHGRGCREKINGLLEDDKVTGDVILPGAPLVSVLDEVACNSGDAEMVVIMGGVNYITERSLKELDILINEVAKPLQGREVLWVEAPTRFDVDDCARNRINMQNKIVLDKCRSNKWGFLNINSLLERSCFNSYGLHLNSKGKDLVCGLIAAYINSRVNNDDKENIPKNLTRNQQIGLVQVD